MKSCGLRSTPCVNAACLRAVRTLLGAGLLGVAALAVCPPALGEERDGKVMVQYGPNTIHYHYSSDHAKQSWLVGAEYIWTNRWLVGFSYFNNSFDQKCQFLYGGYSWVLTGNETRHLYFKLGGGVIVGYRDPYEDKIPVNSNGIGLGVIPALGYQHDRFNVQMNILGTAGLMFTVGYDLFR